MQALAEIPEDSIRVLDHGYVRLRASNATDLSVVNAARVSFAASQTNLDRRAEGLINFLMRERHGSTFEHNMFSFEVRAPKVVVIEWMRHRVSSFNEESGRYHEMQPIFYSPRGRVRTQVGKPGSYEFERVSPEKDDKWCTRIEQWCADSYKLYREMIDDGVAKEVARGVLPFYLYSSFWYTCNARSLMNFLSLRNDSNAMLEIREYAIALETYFNREMPVTAECFRSHGRQAP